MGTSTLLAKMASGYLNLSDHLRHLRCFKGLLETIFAFPPKVVDHLRVCAEGGRSNPNKTSKVAEDGR